MQKFGFFFFWGGDVQQSRVVFGEVVKSSPNHFGVEIVEVEGERVQTTS